MPKINFRYSWIYDITNKKNLDSYRGKLSYPSRQKISEYIKRVEKEWSKIEKEILSYLSKITKIKWKEKEIICYVVGRGRPISDPLTMEVYEKRVDWFIDVIIHELIHRIFCQKNNMEKHNRLSKKYKKNIHITVHIILNAIHKDIYLKFFNKKRLLREIKIFSNYPEYKEAWDFVERNDYKKIIKDFVS